MSAERLLHIRHPHAPVRSISRSEESSEPSGDSPVLMAGPGQKRTLSLASVGVTEAIAKSSNPDQGRHQEHRCQGNTLTLGTTLSTAPSLPEHSIQERRSSLLLPYGRMPPGPPQPAPLRVPGATSYLALLAHPNASGQGRAAILAYS